MSQKAEHRQDLTKDNDNLPNVTEENKPRYSWVSFTHV